MTSRYILDDNQDQKILDAINDRLIVNFVLNEDYTRAMIALSMFGDRDLFFSVTKFDVQQYDENGCHVVPMPKPEVMLNDLPHLDKDGDNIILGHKYIPTFYKIGDKWHITWMNHENGDKLIDYEGDDATELAWKAEKEIQSKLRNT